jgi:hypothetical protein
MRGPTTTRPSGRSRRAGHVCRPSSPRAKPSGSAPRDIPRHRASKPSTPSCGVGQRASSGERWRAVRHRRQRRRATALSRASGRHSTTTGGWSAARDIPPQGGESGRCTDPGRGQPIVRVREAVTPPRHLQVKGDAHPVDPAGAADVHHRAQHLTRPASSPGRAQSLRAQNGRCPVCRPVSQGEEALARHHRDGHHQHNPWVTWGFLPPTCHRQVHEAPESTPGLPRP